MNKNILDSIWLWSHPAGAYNGRWEIPGESKVSPAAAAKYFGVNNAVMVVFANEPEPPFENYARQFCGMDRLVWSVIGDADSKRNNDQSDLRPVLDLKKSMPNLRGAVMDDFFGNGRDNLDKVRKMADELHAAGLELWIVLYDHQLGLENLQEFLEFCDVINFWTWRPQNLTELENNLDRVRTLAPGKDIALGVYLYDFEGGKVIDFETMRRQCETAVKQWENSQVREIVLLGSPLVGMDVETVEWTQRWIKSLA